jgi:hypothetical protein
MALLTTLNWLLASLPTPSGVGNGFSLPPLYGSSTDCPVVGFTQAQLLAIIERSYPREYLEGLRSSPTGGYEQLEAAALVFERVSRAVAELYCCSLLAYAHGPAFSTGVVEFVRETDAEGAITIKAGSFVAASANGRRFVISADVVFGPTDLGPVAVAVVAEEPDQAYDLQGVFLSASGQTLPGEVDTIAELALGSGFDPNMQVRQLASFSGGRTPCLDGLGQDLLVPRFEGESDDRYRLRIIQKPDTVSPAAIERGLDLLLNALGLHACLREVGTERLPGIFYDAGSSADSPQVPANNYAYDMDFSTRPADRFKVWLDAASFRGFFLVGLPPVPDLADFGMAYDGAVTDVFPQQNAYDTTSLTQPNVAYDGFSTLNTSLYMAIYDMINEKRAAGVGFELYLETIGCE